jgi:cytochrome c-type biogenesis protein CcmH/NrfF
MPRGAQTEKAFVREKLEQGLTVDEVIQAVDELYGHRIT